MNVLKHTGTKLKLILAFHKAVAWARNLPPVTAHEAYASSDLKKCVDAIAMVGGVQREGDGSFEVTIETPDEKTIMRFTHEITADGEPKLALQTASRAEFKQVNGPMTFSQSRTSSFDYNLRGKNVSLFVTPAPRFIPWIGGTALLAPDEGARSLLSSLADAAPILCQEVVARTGLPMPRVENKQIPLFPALGL